jgi:hypothetical protein
VVVDAVVEAVRLELAQAVVLVQRVEPAADWLVVRIYRATDVTLRAVINGNRDFDQNWAEDGINLDAFF